MRQCESMSSEGTKTSFWHFLYENGQIFVFLYSSTWFEITMYDLVVLRFRQEDWTKGEPMNRKLIGGHT